MEVAGHNVEKVLEAIQTAKKDVERPTLICCKTIIGFGSPNKSGTSSVHGAALGEDEVKKTRDELGWEYEPFHIPNEIKSEWDGKVAGAAQNASWDKLSLITPIILFALISVGAIFNALEKEALAKAILFCLIYTTPKAL